MRRLLTFAAALLCSLGAAHSLEIPFIGGAQLVGRSAQCPSWLQPYTATSFWNAKYLFPIAGTTNGANSVLSLYTEFDSMVSFVLVGDTFTQTFKTVKAIGNFTRTEGFTSLLRISAPPPAVDTTTRFLAVQFLINNAFNTPNCYIYIDAAFVRTPG